ncbi:MAG: conserved rane protein of unknown function [Frankiales bacterium]|nr:conserved rane protein of unknown function [Frankiales bacterium]
MNPGAVETPVQARGHHLPAAGAAVVAVALVVGLAHLLGDGGRLAAVLVLQLALVVAWVVITGIEGFVGSLVIGAAAAGAADLVIMLPQRPQLGGLLAVLGVGFLAGVLQQMLRRPRPAVVASLAGGILLLCAVCALSVLLLTGRAAVGPALSTAAVLAVGAALVVQHLADLVLPRPQVADGVPRGLAGVLLAVLAGAAVAFLRRGDGLVGTGALPSTVAALLYGALLGGGAALAGLAASFLAVEDPAEGMAGPARSWALPVVQAVLPLAVCAPLALALQTVL